nr:hypothetical protein [Tanacetum cinerariifolium]
AFLVTADVPEIYMQEFWVTAKLHHNSIHFKMDTRKSILDLEAFREMLRISPRIPIQSFAELPFEEEILEFLRHLGHRTVRLIKSNMLVLLDRQHQNQRRVPERRKTKGREESEGDKTDESDDGSNDENDDDNDETVKASSDKDDDDNDKEEELAKNDDEDTKSGVESILTTASSPIVSLQTPTPIMTPSTIAKITKSRDAPIPPTTIPSIILKNLPTFNSAFHFDERLRSLETTFSEYRQTNLFVDATDRLQDSLQRENDEFLRNIDENMKKIIKGQVKSQVKEQVLQEPVQTTCQMEEPSHPVFETGADDQPIVQTSQHPEWFSQPRRPPSPDRDLNKTLTAAQGDAQL